MQPHADAVVVANHILFFFPPPSANQHVSDDQPLRWLPEGLGRQQNVRPSQQRRARLHPGPCQTSCARWLCSWNLLCMTAQGTIPQAASGITMKQAFIQHISHFLQQYETRNGFTSTGRGQCRREGNYMMFGTNVGMWCCGNKSVYID